MVDGKQGNSDIQLFAQLIVKRVARHFVRGRGTTIRDSRDSVDACLHDLRKSRYGDRDLWNATA